ncbi:DUF4265 domain-containing protein [Pseudomonas synxantha]|uniref:DUF4265 domain-containing protein n=1 Tax=Pseudomonas synxantha TaxID=47883 RepID=A0ABS0UDA7_9PSED|nr:DUF4265 domain-containing protein [Pseudomonas synxantha]MBI6563547.1 DUF4265 domain-containing protein [Pseudomonas synxantha]MBI6581269.1 DUF4265 domain-containing protein [Pseudomonas synxantha]MBI6646585.1 DUF4265 domain-containing protein [Pseudomonas synxantha]
MKTDSNNKNIFKKLIFETIKDQDGYPPVEFESIWGIQITTNTFVIDNTPYYIYGLSKGDTVLATMKNNELFGSKIVSKGGHSTLRAFVEQSDIRQNIRDEIIKLGADCNSVTGGSLLAIDIPPVADFDRIDKFLSSVSNNDTIAYEDACLQHNTGDAKREKECSEISSVPF